jgi:primosomal protein N' (replication factor Y) (superfamily II helicase)
MFRARGTRSRKQVDVMANQAFLFDQESDPGRAAIARVVVHLPVEGVFDYRIPRSLDGKVRPGSRVTVNFSGQRVTATCTALSESSEVQDPRELLGLIDSEPLLSPALLDLTRWIAETYQCGWWESIASALPAAARRGGGFRRVLVVRLCLSADETLALAGELLEKRPEQSRCLRILAEEGGRLEANILCRRANVSRSPLETLKKNGQVAFDWIEQERRPITGLAEPDKGEVTLSEEQAVALDAIVRSLDDGGRADFLLFGVTGSGKTEVYLRAIRETVKKGRQAIVLVPEISLTPQTVTRFKNRFDRVAVLHSGLTDAERYAQWRVIRSGRADVVVGARSAIFAPLPRVGLIVVDEEHENSFKQQNTPRYHARAVAIRRGALEGASVVFGTATPSLETWRAAQEGWIRMLRLRSRVGGGTFPDVSVVHMGLQGKRAAGFLSERLRLAVDDTLSRGHQTILFLNRRGYHTAVFCTGCREPVRCPGCEIALTYHRGSNRVICHYCGHEALPPKECPACHAPDLRYIGSGTERVEAEVKRCFEGATVFRMDSDTMATRNAHEIALEKFRKGDVDILIGTQMIAKGLDFPNVTLVGVVSADTSLLLPDFRSAERTFQLISQVAGRAGRGTAAGRVFVQTYSPEHYAIELAVENDFERFAGIELDSRRTLGYPPYGRLLRVVFSAEAESDAMRLATDARRVLDAADLPEGTTILGPARAPLTKISGRFRWHIMVKGRSRKATTLAGLALRMLSREQTAARRGPPQRRGKGAVSGVASAARGPRMQIDVDPLSML